MKKRLVLCLLIFAFLAVPASASGPVTRQYGDKTLSNWSSGHWAEVWDLTQCDLTLSYTLNMSGITSAGWAVTEVGLRQTGAPNLDPNGQGGWMQSNYVLGASNPNTLNNNDMHLLSKHGWSEQVYDAEDADTLVAPYWSNANHGFWFDRDGVDQWQAQQWGMAGVYNTGGIYDIVITYHALNANQATMFATVNGVQQGLYVGGYKNAEPEFYPAGRSFTGNMASMQVFYGRGGGGGSVVLSGIQVTGCPYWTDISIDIKPGSDPNSINLKSKGVVPVAVLTTGEFDAATIDPATVVFAGAAPVRWTTEDVDGDGDMDMLFHFKTQALNLNENSTSATLTGETSDGKHIRGTDAVRIVPAGK